MKYINEKKLDRIRELSNKSEAYILKNNIPINDWETFNGFYSNNIGLGAAYINGLSEDEKQELIMYGYYTHDEFFDIQRDSYLASKTTYE